MIISFQHNYIFIKTRKVAGTSVEAMLRQFTGSGDIIPGITPRDEFFCASRGLYSKNYAEDPLNEQRYTELILEKKFEEAIAFYKNMKKKFTSHMPAKRIKAILTKSDIPYENFFKFTIDRHPYTWLISKINYANKKYNAKGVISNGNKDLTQAIKQQLNSKLKINQKMYMDKGKLLVDFIAKYETLESDLQFILSTLNLNSDSMVLPQLKVGAPADGSAASLNQEIKNLVQIKFAKTFQLLGYDM